MVNRTINPIAFKVRTELLKFFSLVVWTLTSQSGNDTTTIIIPSHALPKSLERYPVT